MNAVLAIVAEEFRAHTNYLDGLEPDLSLPQEKIAIFRLDNIGDFLMKSKWREKPAKIRLEFQLVLRIFTRL